MKQWYTSKVVWLGVLTTIIGVVPVLVALANAYQVDLTAVGTAVLGVLTVVMRVWFTNEPLSAKAVADKAATDAALAEKQVQ